MMDVIEKRSGSKERSVSFIPLEEHYNFHFEEPKTTKKVQKGNMGCGRGGLALICGLYSSQSGPLSTSVCPVAIFFSCLLSSSPLLLLVLSHPHTFSSLSLLCQNVLPLLNHSYSPPPPHSSSSSSSSSNPSPTSLSLNRNVRAQARLQAGGSRRPSPRSAQRLRCTLKEGQKGGLQQWHGTS